MVLYRGDSVQRRRRRTSKFSGIGWSGRKRGGVSVERSRDVAGAGQRGDRMNVICGACGACTALSLRTI